MAQILSTLSSDGLAGTPENGGQRYVLMSTWEAAQQGDLTGTGNVAGEPSTSVLECYEGTTIEGKWDADGAIDDELAISGWDVDQDSFITVRSSAGNLFWMHSATNEVLRLSDSYTRIENIKLESKTASYSIVTAYGSSDVTIERCRLLDVATNKYQLVADTNWIVRNCLFETQYRVTDIRPRTGVIFENNTLISKGGSYGALTDNNNTLTNNVSYGFSSGDFLGMSAGDTYNASSDTSSGAGTGAVTGVTAADFSDYAGGDYSPASSGKLDGTGADLSADFTDDITGFTRTVPWDIGAYAVQGGVVPTPPTNVEAGGAYSGTVGTPIAIDGASFTPGTGSADVILWTFIGPGGTWDDDSILSPTFTPDAVDTYALTLTVTNDTGNSADTASLTSGAAPAVSFDGPDILAQTGTENVLFSFQENGGGTVASRFTGATSYALAPTSDALPTGLTVNEITGNIEGTPTVAGEFTNIIIEGSDQPLFNFNGTDQYATHTAWECLGDPAVYESVTYEADPDDGFIIGAARPITEIGRVGANYHAGPAWGVQYNDSSPIQDTYANIGDGNRYGELEQSIVLDGDLEIEWDGIVQAGISWVLTDAAGTSGIRVAQSSIQVFNNGTGGVIANTSLDVGQHYKGRFTVLSGVAAIYVDDLEVATGPQAISSWNLILVAGSAVQPMTAGQAFQNTIVRDIDNNLTWIYGLDEGAGTDIVNSDPSTQGNYNDLPLFDTYALMGDGTRTVGSPSFEFGIGGSIKLDVIYSDGTFLDGSTPVLTGVAGVITAGFNVSNITVNGEVYGGETIADGTHLTIGCDISSVTVTTIGPMASGAAANLIMESNESIGYKINDGSGLEVLAYDIVNGEFGAPIPELGDEKWTGGNIASAPSVINVDEEVHFSAAASGNYSRQNPSNTEDSVTYEYSYEVYDVVSGGNCSFNFGSVNGTITNGAGVFTGRGVANAASHFSVMARQTNDQAFKVRNISVRKVQTGTITPDADWEYIPEYSNNGMWTDTDWTFIADNSRNYPMNEGTGATLFDAIGGHDATIQNFTDEWQ